MKALASKRSVENKERKKHMDFIRQVVYLLNVVYLSIFDLNTKT